MKIGDLVKHKEEYGTYTLWLLLDYSSVNVFVISTRTSYKMWAKKSEFEVIQ